MATPRKHNHILHDLAVISASILLAVWLQSSGEIGRLVGSSGGIYWLESILAGFFFTSAFTTAPAIVLLGNLAQHTSPFVVAVFGGIGAMTGDILIFRFFRDAFVEDFFTLVSARERSRIMHIFRLRLFRWFTPFIAALIIASPLPDELAMILMGFSRTATRIVVAFSYVANTMGILLIALAAKALG